MGAGMYWLTADVLGACGGQVGLDSKAAVSQCLFSGAAEAMSNMLCQKTYTMVSSAFSVNKT